VSDLILLVEDNPSDEKLALRALRECGISSGIAVARDGAEALEYLFHPDRQGALPRLALLDLKLPRVSGLEVIRRVRAEERARLLPIVVLTASQEENDIVRSRSLGANAYVRKPVDFKEFVEVLRTLTRFWLTLNEPIPGHPQDKLAGK
jgi:two-component system response regulator